MAVTAILGLMVAVITVVYLWSKYTFSYWRRKNIPYDDPIPFIGNTKDIFTMRNSFGLYLSELYRDPRFQKAPAVGVYIFNQPALVLRETELVKSVLIKDFPMFSNRISSADPHGDKLGYNNLFFVKNPQWKELRTRISPVFTTGKIKQMYPLMLQIAAELETHLSGYRLDDAKSFITEMKQVCALFTTDLIATIAFGIRVDSLKNPNVEFRQQAKKIFEFNLGRAKDFFISFFFPKLVSLLRVKLFSKEFSAYLRSTINHVITERESSGNRRNDLIDILVALKKEAAVDKSHVARENDMLVAQAAVFLTAGFETSSSTMAFTLYELARRPDLQKRLREEVAEALALEGGQLSYERIMSLEYLGMVVDETLRLYPTLPFLDREYMSQNGKSNLTLQPYLDYTMVNGMPVYIPIYGLQRDPKYWTNPDTFDPERFSPENKKSIEPMAYLPFGTGPHNCIGSRIGLLQSKIGLVHFLKNHRVEPCEQTVTEMVFDPKAFVLQSKKGIYLKVVNDDLYAKKANMH